MPGLRCLGCTSMSVRGEIHVATRNQLAASMDAGGHRARGRVTFRSQLVLVEGGSWVRLRRAALTTPALRAPPLEKEGGKKSFPSAR
jgi:hypothetical protein